jgi:3-deoxy-D-manno-octulosonic acid (KDO) 8-phosphate synthase
MKLGDFEVGLDKPFFLIAGTCVVESEQMTIDTAGKLKEICAKLKIPFIYKSSYDKANRSSGKSFRGLGMDEGLRILSEVKKQLGLPVLTDVHSSMKSRRWHRSWTCCRRRRSCAVRPISSTRARVRASRSTSRRASFSRRTT